MIPQEIINEYNLTTIVESDGWCYAEMRKAVYGLKEISKLSNVELKKVLAKEGYVPSKFTPGLFTHETRDIAFSLCIDDFGVRYVHKEDADHLVQTIEKRYPIKVSWNPDYYLGITLKWDYEKQTVELSMTGYVEKALLKFQHVWNGQHCASPSPFTPIQYGRRTQMVKVDNTAPMDKK